MAELGSNRAFNSYLTRINHRGSVSNQDSIHATPKLTSYVFEQFGVTVEIPGALEQIRLFGLAGAQQSIDVDGLRPIPLWISERAKYFERRIFHLVVRK